MPKAQIMQRHSNGLIAVEQLPKNGWDISYNPDDRRFYVAQVDEHGDLKTKATFAELRNARQYAGKHTAH